MRTQPECPGYLAFRAEHDFLRWPKGNMMKKTIAVIMALVCVGMFAVADDGALVSADTARVKSLSLDAIKAKYSTCDLSSLQYTGFTAIASTNEQIVLSVTFLDAHSGTTEDLNINVHPMTKKKNMTYTVTLDNLGNVRGVSTGSSISIESSSHRKTASQPSEVTR